MSSSIGEYSQRILVKKLSLAAADGTGQQVETWPTAATNKRYWVKARRLSGAERIAAGQLASSQMVEFRTHGMAPDIHSTDRIVWLGTEYAISAIYTDETENEVIINAFLPLTGV